MCRTFPAGENQTDSMLTHGTMLLILRYLILSWKNKMQNDSIPESSMRIIIKSVFIIDKIFVVEL